MLFSEIYGAYYNCVAEILKIACDHKPSMEEMMRVTSAKGFEETNLVLIPALQKEQYKLIRADGTTPIRKAPQMPLTTLQKRWLKAVMNDPRFALFGETIEGLEDVEPLFALDSIQVFDKYGDGDPFGDPDYIAKFKIVREAIRSGSALNVKTRAGSGNVREYVMVPEFLEYSEKDDKFRVIGRSRTGETTFNLARLMEVSRYEGETPLFKGSKSGQEREVVFELFDRRNALERVMLHFAHFEKETIRVDDDRYIVKLRYDKDDETELVIRVLSFGPMIKVTEPQQFIKLIRERIRKQADLFS